WTATEISGPVRLSTGTVRDLLIGITVVLADGTVIKGGGRVVKNVAGYDLMKLFTGSLGTLGIIAEATFKVRPCPAHEALFVLPATDTAAAVARGLDVLAAPLAPLFVEAVNQPAATAVGVRAEGPAVVVGCGGAAEEIAVQHERIEQQFGASGVITLEAQDAARLSAALRDFASGGNGAALEPVPSGNTLVAKGPREQSRTAGFYGCRISLLPSRL